MLRHSQGAFCPPAKTKNPQAEGKKPEGEGQGDEAMSCSQRIGSNIMMGYAGEPLCTASAQRSKVLRHEEGVQPEFQARDSS